jgi:hypothetical protein
MSARGLRRNFWIGSVEGATVLLSIILFARRDDFLAGVYSEWRPSKNVETVKSLLLNAMAVGFTFKCVLPYFGR